MNLILLTPPQQEPVSLPDAKKWLRLDGSDEDDLVTAMITAARALVETVTRRALPGQSWRVICDGWSSHQRTDELRTPCRIRPQKMRTGLYLPLAPVQSLTAVRYYDADGHPQILGPAHYQLVGAPDRAHLNFASPLPAPGRPEAGVEIDCVAGYGAPEAVPAPLRQAILAMLALWYENRGDGPAFGPDNLPKRIASLLAPYRLARLV